MFSESTIAACILPLVQFSQANDPAYSALDNRLTSSLTGRTVQSAFALCTIENLKNAAPDFTGYTYPAFAQAVDYKKGVMVTYNAVNYVSLIDIPAASNNQNPDASIKWQTSNPFNDWLYQLKYQAAIELCTTLMRNRKLANTSKSLLENTRMYEVGGILTDRIINEGAFVGICLELKPNQNIVNYITQIGIQTDGPVAGLPVYLFHSSRSAPIATMSINAQGGLSFNWTAFDTPVAFKNFDTDPETGHDVGGRFFLGYYQADLNGVQAIRKQFNMSARPCLTCDGYNLTAYKKWNKFISATTFKVQSENLLSGDPQLWDLADTEYVYDTNWGFNVAFSVACDVSEFICSNKMLFADSYAQLLALKCAQAMVNSTRINGVSAQTKALAGAELDPKKGSGSLMANYVDSINAIDYDISGFDENCLACTTKGRIGWGDSI